MPFRSPTATAQRNWLTLDAAQRFVAVMSAARRLSASGQMARLGESVTGLGFGRRERRVHGKRQILAEPVLVVFVQEKWQPGDRRAASEAAIPPAIQMRLPVADRRVELAIPTDVCQEPPVPKVQSDRNGICVRSNTSPTKLRGSVCALLRRAKAPDNGARYLLGCHHVIFRSTLDPNGRADSGSFAYTLPDGEQYLGYPTRPARYGPDEAASIDAALVRLDAEGLKLATRKSFWKTVPFTWASEAQVEMFARSGMKLVSQHGEDIERSYVRHRYNQKVKNLAGAVVNIGLVIVAETTVNSARARPECGDSGSPIVADSILLSMHIAGDEWGTSYSIPAFTLFKSTTFSERFILASNDITD